MNRRKAIAGPAAITALALLPVSVNAGEIKMDEKKYYRIATNSGNWFVDEEGARKLEFAKNPYQFIEVQTYWCSPLQPTVKTKIKPHFVESITPYKQ